MKSIENYTVLIVEDHKVEQKVLEEKLTNRGFRCLLADDGIEALEILKKEEVGIILSDQSMPRLDGLQLLIEVKKQYGEIPFIMLTGMGTIDSAIVSIRQGAVDYIQKPYNFDELLSIISRSLNYYRLNEENIKLKTQLRSRLGLNNMVTNSKAMKDVLEKTKKVAAIPNTTIAIFGENGCGKGLLARAIHAEGKRMEYNFVSVNCAGMPATLLDSELFGHVKGAFTGADQSRQGKFDLAQKGTILLDEIGDMPLDLQAKLLIVLEERTYERLGSNTSIKADVRVIVATNRNLEEMVGNGRFREDLYHRITAFPITIPPLRERKEDIPLLANHFLNYFREEFGRPLPGISKEAMDYLINYSWPGNVRELKNSLERAAILSDNELLQVEHLRGRAKPGEPVSGMVDFNFKLPEDKASLDNIFSKVKETILKHCDNNKSKAAKILKKDRNIFYR